MLSANQLTTMLKLQAELNAKVNPNWLFAGYPFLRAAMVEGVEGIEHHGWKWWKAQTMDLPQLQMELVDIWHFALSFMLVKGDGQADVVGAEIANKLNLNVGVDANLIQFDGNNYWLPDLDLLSKLELLVGLATVRRFSIALFSSILTDADMTWNALYLQYVGKNVLNLFRQANGYKQGTYQKLWGGREDNEHLVEVLASLREEEGAEVVYGQLAARYAAAPEVIAAR